MLVTFFSNQHSGVRADAPFVADFDPFAMLRVLGSYMPHEYDVHSKLVLDIVLQSPTYSLLLQKYSGCMRSVWLFVAVLTLTRVRKCRVRGRGMTG